jgi:hypothetical protein
MCRNIKTLFNFEPPATDEEIQAAALQFVRKLSGFNKPSQANAAAFEKAVHDTFQVARELITSLATQSPPRNREIEAERAKARAAKRFA